MLLLLRDLADRTLRSLGVTRPRVNAGPSEVVHRCTTRVRWPGRSAVAQDGPQGCDDRTVIESAAPLELVKVLGRVPELMGRELILTALSGGITNRNFLIEPAGTAERFVVRLAGNDTHLLGISREVELAATVTAAGVGIGPEVVAFIRPEGYLVTRFIEGAPVPVERVRDPAMLARVADSVRRFHDGPAIPGLFIPLRLVEAYRALAHERGVPIPPEYERARHVGHRIELALLASPLELRPGHNDLLNANFIDDGLRIRIVDWEYAGMGDPFFDLGNFATNNDLPIDADADLLAAYDRGPVEAARLARLRLMRVVSDFREAMWGVLQQGISTLDEDFVAYASKHFDRLLSTASTPAFAAALDEAAGQA
jgi:thiamine kinase-like enzyme